MAVIRLLVFGVFLVCFSLSLSHTFSFEDSVGEMSSGTDQLSRCGSRVVTHLEDLIEDVRCLRSNTCKKEAAQYSVPDSESGCKVPHNDSFSNGEVRLAVDWMGLRMIWFKCNAGFSLLGNPALVCRENAWNGSLPVCVPKDCMAHHSIGRPQDGVYGIVPDGQTPILAYCDMTTDGGGWTVFQRRVDATVNFYRPYKDYQNGFGDIEGNIWLGLNTIHLLTESKSELYVDMVVNETRKGFAKYSDFLVADSADGYKLSISGYSGNAGDSLIRHNGMKFTTYDRDQDMWENNCAKNYNGAWWYKDCHNSNLNGLYLDGYHSSWANGVNWKTLSSHQYSLKWVEMKMRRKL